MDVMGSDVSLKIRSAIKAKLVELGAYVDEELPDYIMVMVANKKNKNQMTDDLMLFLGNNTDKFTTWLHEVLDRLQSVTSDTKKKNEGKLRDKIEENKFTDSIANRGKGTKIHRNQEEKYIPKKTRDDSRIIETDENQEEVLAIKADFDADELLVEELHDEIVMPSKIAKTTIVKQQNIVSPLQKSEIISQTSDGLITKQNIVLKETSHMSKRSASTTIYPVSVKPRIPNSAISSIVHLQDRDEDEDEDFSTPVGGLASVIKVSKRRPSLPPKLQANKTLILRAMEEAKKSVIAAAHKFPVKIEPFKKTVDETYIVRKHKIDPDETPRKRLRLSEVNEEAEYQDEMDSLMLDPSPEENKTIHSPSIISPYHSEILDERMNIGNVRRIVHDSQMEDNKCSNPKFIVTLDGVDPEVFLNKPKTSVLKGVRSHDLDDSEPLITPIAINLDDTEVSSYGIEDDASQLAVLQNLSHLKKQKISERCKYWPACKNGDSCLYRHPTVPCKTFPKCKYAEKCLYIHPNCRFDATCSRKDCPYTHASKRQIIQMPTPTQSKCPPKASSTKEIRCKFFPQCTNMNCTYFHPKACRYGLSCTQHGCIYAHPPLPSRDKLKWKAVEPSHHTIFPVQKENIS